MRPSIVRAFPLALALAAGTMGLTAAAAGAATLASPTISGGAVGSAGGSFRLAGTVGEAGVVGQTAGGSYVLTEGFWRPGLGYVSAVGPDPQDPATDGANFANALVPNHPNPFSGGTTLAFSVARNAEVSLEVFDLAGRRIRRLLAATLPAGRHTMHWDGRDDRGAPVASGLYHARLNINDWSATKRMLMVR
ncbi:MAG: T9SS type A sorting domain-containing protein [bacterium]|nr:T9SS type A sorting domain-containing protein [bacterium]